jgi:hypothetical protein
LDHDLITPRQDAPPHRATNHHGFERRKLLLERLGPWRQRSYADLNALLDRKFLFDNDRYKRHVVQGDIRVVWDDKPGARSAVGGIDDGGWRAYPSLRESFILATDGTFVGE